MKDNSRDLSTGAVVLEVRRGRNKYWGKQNITNGGEQSIVLRETKKMSE